MSLKKKLEEMEPWASVSVMWLLDQWDEADEREVSTREASDRLGRSPKWWRQQCEGGLVEGAYRDSEDSPWRLPLASCRKHLCRVANKRRVLRGPTRKAAPAPPTRFGPKSLSQGTVLVDGLPSLGRVTLRVEEPA